MLNNFFTKRIAPISAVFDCFKSEEESWEEIENDSQHAKSSRVHKSTMKSRTGIDGTIMLAPLGGSAKVESIEDTVVLLEENVLVSSNIAEDIHNDYYRSIDKASSGRSYFFLIIAPILKKINFIIEILDGLSQSDKMRLAILNGNQNTPF